MPTFTYTGNQQTYVVPSGVTSLIIECWGAEGGTGRGNNQPIYGGYGGYSKGTLSVSPGETIYIYVGGRGTDGGTTTGVQAGGFNGGGAGYAPENSYAGAGGGGATDVRQGGTALSNRKIVAGGGGGGNDGGNSRAGQRDGGDGGGNSGTAAKGSSNTSGVLYPQGGTQSAGGSGGYWSSSYAGNSGQLGIGGSYPNVSYPAGAGGGGYYGGGSGQYISGGGGSGYVGGVTNSTNTTSTRTGHGEVIITIPNTKPTASNLYSAAVNPLVDSKLTWSYSDPESNAQVSYQIGWRKQGSGENHNFYTYDSANPYHAIPAGTLEEGVTYDWAVRVKDSLGLWSDYATSQFTSISPYRLETAINLVPNPGAEISTSGWSTGVTLSRSTAKASSGSASFMLSRTSLGNINISRRLDAKPGQKFIIRAKFSAGTGVTVPRTARIDYAFEKADTSRTYAYTVLTSASVPIDGSWIEISGLTVAAPELTEKLYIVPGLVDVNSGENFHIDDIQVLVDNGRNQNTLYFDGDSTAKNSKFYWLGESHNSPSVKEIFAYENWAQDPRATNTATGFGRFTADRWGGNTSYSWITGATDGPLGIPTYLRATVTSGRTSLGFHLAGNPETTTSYQSVPVQPGETINVSNYIRSSVATNWQVAIRFANASNQWIDTFTGNPMAVAANTWTRVHHERVVPAGASWASAYVVAPASLPTGTIFEGTGLQITKSPLTNYFDGSYKEGNGKPNLFTNPSAETDLGGLSVNRVTLSRSSDWASDGLWSVKATRTADTSTDSYIELISCLPGGTNALLPNTTYTIAATYKLDDKFATAPESGSGLNQRLSIFVHLNNTTRGIVTGINKNNQTGRLRLVFTTPASFATAPNTIRLYAGGSPGEYIYWDDWALYEGDVEIFNGEGNLFSWTGNANNSNSIRTTYGSWKELSEVSSTTASGIIAANKLQPGDYEIQVAAQDADAIWGEWGAPETFALGPASNLLVKSGGTFATGLRLVKQGGVWVETGVTKVKSGGVFI